MSIPDWLSWNQNSVFESQSEIDTWQGGICKSCRLLRGRRQLQGGAFLRSKPLEILGRGGDIFEKEEP